MTHAPKSLSPARFTGIILLAFGLFAMNFAVDAVPFWPGMTLTGLCLGAIALRFSGPLRWFSGWTWQNIFIGICGAGALYAVFWGGDLLIRAVLPETARGIEQVYTLKSGIPAWVIVLTLLVIIGPAEELFWRALVQQWFQNRMPHMVALLAATALYTSVHLPTGNPVLLAASATGGLFWGGLYLWRRSVVPGLICHTLWDIAVFVIWPFHG